MTPLEFVVPIETKSTLNQREHWAVKARRHKAQRQAVALRVPREAKSIGPFLVVTLTRISPRQLDGDNLQGSLKAVRDQVASALGVDDRTSLVRWDYGQETGEPGVRVRIEVAP